jgi:metal-sulfur cluster biosynthetic enzyme
MTAGERAWSALGQVRDPELDRPITDLGFVATVQIDEPSSVRVVLRLPTYFCAPNFAWLMVADARDALAAVFDHVSVVLLEHFVSDEINAGVAAVSSFSATLTETSPEDPELASLRAVFERKAHLAAQERLARALVTAGIDRSALSGTTFADASSLAPAEAAAVARRRSRIGVESRWAICDEDGSRLTADKVPAWLRFAQTVRVSIDGNAGFCQGLLETRYGLAKAN